MTKYTFRELIALHVLSHTYRHSARYWTKWKPIKMSNISEQTTTKLLNMLNTGSAFVWCFLLSSLNICIPKLNRTSFDIIIRFYLVIELNDRSVISKLWAKQSHGAMCSCVYYTYKLNLSSQWIPGLGAGELYLKYLIDCQYATTRWPARTVTKNKNKFNVEIEIKIKIKTNDEWTLNMYVKKSVTYIIFRIAICLPKMVNAHQYFVLLHQLILSIVYKLKTYFILWLLDYNWYRSAARMKITCFFNGQSKCKYTFLLLAPNRDWDYVHKQKWNINSDCKRIPFRILRQIHVNSN